MNSSRLRSTGGSVLVVAAVAAAVLSISVAGFLRYMTNQSILNRRSAKWNQSLHLAEAAVEVGFEEYAYQYSQGGSGFQSSRGWNSLGGGSYSKTVSNLNDSGGNVVGSFTVIVSGVGSSSPQIQGVGTCTGGIFGDQSVSRAVKVVLSSSSMFPVGLMSKNQINLNGNNAYTDSYDSSDPMKSSNGMYDPGKKQPHGDVASNSVLVDSIGIGNADIYGKVATGPGGSVTIGPNGSVGATFDESQRATTVSAGIADGWIRSDFSVDMPDPSLPSGAMFWPSLGAINNTSTISGGGWQASSINMSGNRTLTISGNVTLYVTGSTSTSGNGSIVILPGASLTIYSAGSVSIAGNGIVNNANYPVNDVIYGLSTCASVSVSGNGAFVGAIYAPEAALGIGGNGSVYGAVVASSITLSGNANFHYDESLKNLTAGSYYQVASWQELRNVNGVWQ